MFLSGTQILMSKIKNRNELLSAMQTLDMLYMQSKSKFAPAHQLKKKRLIIKLRKSSP